MILKINLIILLLISNIYGIEKKIINIPMDNIERDAISLTKGKFNQLNENQKNLIINKLKKEYINQEILINISLDSDINKDKEYKLLYKKELEKIIRTISVNVWAKRELEKIIISEKDINDYYQKNINSKLITIPEKYTFYQIISNENNIKKAFKEIQLSDNKSYIKQIFKKWQKESIIKEKSFFEKIDISNYKVKYKEEISKMKINNLSMFKIEDSFILLYLLDKEDIKVLETKKVEKEISEILQKNKFKDFLMKKIKEKKIDYLFIEK